MKSKRSNMAEGVSTPRGTRHARGSTAGARPDEVEVPCADTPVPPESLHLTLTTLASGQVLHRVHLQRYGAVQFNPGTRGNARFSPIQDRRGASLPTLYAGTTLPCALMETVFHDVPHTPGFKSLDKAKLLGQQHSTVQVLQDLRLADLGSVALRKLGVPRRQLIDTEKDQYPATRKWAEAMHRASADVQGLS